jgi:hypothetical protein
MAVQLDVATLEAALAGYQQRLDEIQKKMAEIRRQLGQTGRKAKDSGRTSLPRNSRRRHRISAEGRARIAAAQRERWARTKKQGKKPGDN